MPTILALDTSLGECSVALWREGTVIAEEIELARNRQTSQLIPMVESVLQKAACHIQDVAQFVTTAGPGSFTGIRIGLSAARGFTLATSAPTLAVSTLELLAWQASEAKPAAAYAAFINAYRGEIYTQIFTTKGRMTPLTEAIACTPEDAKKLIDPYASLTCAGDAVSLVTGVEAAAGAMLPSAAALARYAGLHSLNADDYLPQPLYIRAPDAKVQEAYLLASQSA